MLIMCTLSMCIVSRTLHNDTSRYTRKTSPQTEFYSVSFIMHRIFILILFSIAEKSSHPIKCIVVQHCATLSERYTHLSYSISMLYKDFVQRATLRENSPFRVAGTGRLDPQFVSTDPVPVTQRILCHPRVTHLSP